MDPQVFLRLSIGSLGLRIPATEAKAIQANVHGYSSPFLCEIRLQGFPVQRVVVPLISSTEANPDPHGHPCIFFLENSDVKALLAPTCFSSSLPYLEVTVFVTKQHNGCGFISRKKQIGMFRLEVSSEWGAGRSVLLYHGWIAIGKNRKEKSQGPELHLRVKLDPDPRYVFQFDDEIFLNPQIVQLQGSIKQPIFSCKFSRDRRTSVSDPSSKYLSSCNGSTDGDADRMERKGWKVMIHDLRGSTVAVASMTTPFVPSTGSDRVSQSNPGAWLILRPDPVGQPNTWHPWGRLEAWRETEAKDSICLRLHLLPDGYESGILVSDVLVSADKGGEFFIDMDRQTSNGTNSGADNIADVLGYKIGGFVMKCKVQGEKKKKKSSKLLVQLATRHVASVEHAAIFMALAAAVDLSIEACRPFRRKAKRTTHNSL